MNHPLDHDRRLDRIYRALLRLLPAEFRGDFGDAMAADFAEATAAERGWRLAALVARELPALVLGVIRQHTADFLQDAAFAWRLIVRGPVAAFVIVLTFAIGIGANTAIFSVVDAVLLRSPFHDPSRIVLISDVHDPARRSMRRASADEIARLRSMTAVFDSVTGLDLAVATSSDLSVPRFVDLECVSADVFRVLGIQPQLGRAFEARDDRPGADPVVIVSDAFWRETLGGSAGVMGRTIRLNDHPVTVIGVLPPSIEDVRSVNRRDAWAPLAAGSETGCNPEWSVNVYARIRPDLTLDSANARLLALTAGARGLVSLDESTVGDERPTLLVLTVAVAFVLLIGCANVAGLLAERAVTRRREIATRLALGAGRGRLVRQMLTESVILALAGTAMGLVVAFSAVAKIVTLLPEGLPHSRDIALNSRVLIVTVAAGWFAGLLSGLLPALQLVDRRIASSLHDARGSTGRGRSWTRRMLLVGEVALSVALLVAATLATRSFLTLRPTHPGFDASNMLAVTIRVADRSDNQARWKTLFQEVTSRFGALPGVTGVSGSTETPLTGTVTMVPVHVSGLPDAALPRRVFTSTVTANFFAEMRMPIVRGRDFGREDERGGPVAIINETLARHVSPDGNALGREVVVDGRFFDRTPARIVGVVADARLFSGSTHGSPQVYVLFARHPKPHFTLMVRAASPTGSVAQVLRREVTRIDPTLFVISSRSLNDVLERSMAPWRFVTWLMTLFAVMAVGLAAVGLAAVVASAVTQRQNEIGIRMALGADRGSVMRLMLSQTMDVTVYGVIFGLVLAFATTRFLADSLYELSPRDPLTFAMAAALMLATAALASYLPARRATRIDPIVTLRAD